jgi:hypothetical protein
MQVFKGIKFINLVGLLFLIMASAVGVALVSGKSELFNNSYASNLSVSYSCLEGILYCDNGIIYVCQNGNFVVKRNCIADGYVGCKNGTGNQRPQCIRYFR